MIIKGWVVMEREKSVLFVPQTQMDSPVWLPRSQITITENEWDDMVELPSWLAQNNNIKTLPPAPRGKAA